MASPELSLWTTERRLPPPRRCYGATRPAAGARGTYRILIFLRGPKTNDHNGEVLAACRRRVREDRRTYRCTWTPPAGVGCDRCCSYCVRLISNMYAFSGTLARGRRLPASGAKDAYRRGDTSRGQSRGSAYRRWAARETDGGDATYRRRRRGDGTANFTNPFMAKV